MSAPDHRGETERMPESFIEAMRPIDRSEGRGQQILPVGSIQHKEVAITRGLHQHLMWAAMEVAIGHYYFCSVFFYPLYLISPAACQLNCGFNRFNAGIHG